jgi:hypothetical protein
MYAMTGLFASAMCFLSLRSLQEDDFQHRDWIFLIVASLILAATRYGIMHARRFLALISQGLFIFPLLMVLFLLGMFYSGYAVFAVLAAFFVSTLYRSPPVVEQWHSRHVPFTALALTALFLTSAHEIATLFEAQFRRLPEAWETIHFSVYEQRGYSFAYPEKWVRLPLTDGMQTAFQRAGALFWEGGFIISHEPYLPASYKEAASSALEQFHGSGEDAIEVPFSQPEGRATGREFAMTVRETGLETPVDPFPVHPFGERVHVWVWNRYVGRISGFWRGIVPRSLNIFAGTYTSKWPTVGKRTAPQPHLNHFVRPTMPTRPCALSRLACCLWLCFQLAWRYYISTSRDRVKVEFALPSM